MREPTTESRLGNYEKRQKQTNNNNNNNNKANKKTRFIGAKAKANTNLYPDQQYKMYNIREES